MQRYLVFAAMTMLATAVTTVALLGLAVRAGGLRSRTTLAVLGLGVVSAVVVGAIDLDVADRGAAADARGRLALRGLRGVGLDHPSCPRCCSWRGPSARGALYTLNAVWPIGQVD